MKQIGMAVIFFLGSFCFAQQPGNFQPSETNVWGSEYPRVDDTGRVQIRVKAPDAMKIKVNFWSGPKVDMENRRRDSGLLQLLPLFPAFTITH